MVSLHIVPNMVAKPAASATPSTSRSERHDGRSRTNALTQRIAADVRFEPAGPTTSQADSSAESDVGSTLCVSASPRPRPLLEQLRERWRDRPIEGILAQWPAAGNDRIRRVITRSGVRRRYAIPCYRYGNREAQCEAAEEAAACILLDACAGVEFQEQPFRLEFPWLGKVHQHVPDLLVASLGRYELWECKREAEAGKFWIRKRAEHLQALLAPVQIGYRVVTGREVFSGHYLGNARLLRRCATRPVSPSVASELALQLRSAGPVPIQQMQQRLGATFDIGDILALLYRGALCTDLKARLTAQSLIYLPDKDGRPPWVWQLFDAASA